MTIEERVYAYETDTDFLDISGMEYLEMLFNRSEIAKLEEVLSYEQKARLFHADLRLVRDANRFYKAIQSIADLKSWREQEQVPPQHWWWYLDVLVATPLASMHPSSDDRSILSPFHATSSSPLVPASQMELIPA